VLEKGPRVAYARYLISIGRAAKLLLPVLASTMAKRWSGELKLETRGALERALFRPSLPLNAKSTRR